MERAVGLWKGSLELGACSRFGESGHRGADTSWERGQACCAPRSCAVGCETWGEPESLRSQGVRPVGPCLAMGRWRGDVEAHTTSHHEGEGSLHGLVAALSINKRHVIKTLKGPVYPLSVLGFFSLLFLCVNEVAPCP